MTRPIFASISAKAISHNLELAKVRSPSAFTWAVIKANAYGHGIERVYAGLGAADGLAMLDFEEARRVRALGWDKPILMLEGVFDAADARDCHQLGLTPVVHHFQQLDWLIAEHAPFEVYVKINSGMNRLGFAIDDLPRLARLLSAQPHIQIKSWMTHFANADSELKLEHGTDGALDTHAQQARFELAMKELFTTHAGLQAPFSLSNSAAILNVAQMQAGSVRAGIMLYGASPFSWKNAPSLGLRPAMQLQSQIIAVQQLKAGDTVGYGSTFTAPRTMLLGVVACGYADGYPRHAPTGTPIAVDGVMTRIVGRVSMDMLTVDLSPTPQAKIGSAVELWGNTVPIDAVASAAGTIAYELMCALAPRVPVFVLG